MKKLLSLVLVALMVLSSVATCFAVDGSVIPDRGPTPDTEDWQDGVSTSDDYTIDSWLSDATIAEGETSCKVYWTLDNNCGLWAARMCMAYPECFTVSAKVLYNKRDKYDENYVLYTKEDATVTTNIDKDGNGGNYETLCIINEAEEERGLSDTTRWDIPGYENLSLRELTVDHNYRQTVTYIQSEAHYYTQEDEDYDYDNDVEDKWSLFVNLKPVDKPIIEYTFTYDESLNTTGATSFEIINYTTNVDAIFSYGENGNSTGEARMVMYNGTITVPSKTSGDCAHENTHEESVAPTCTVPGANKVICDDCGKTIETAEVNALGHDEVEIPAVEPTCTDTGLTAGVKCNRCGEILTEQQEVSKGAHKAVQANGQDRYYIVTAPTTSTAGTLAKKCSMCKEYFEATEIAALDQYAVTIKDVSVTVGETVRVGIYLDNPSTGSVSFVASPYWSDELSVEVSQGDIAFENETFSFKKADDKLLNIIKNDKNTPHGIDFDYDGLTTGVLYVSSEDITTVNYNDGYVAFFDITAPMTAGEYKFGVVLNDDYATLLNGTAILKYDVEKIVEATVTVNACTHDGYGTVDVPAVEPTCTDTGLTAGVKCGHCGEMIVEQTEVPANGHDYGDWYVSKPATTASEGEKRRDCKNCDAYETEVIEKLMLLNLRPEWGYYANAAECSIDNEARVINITTKKNAPTVDFRLLNSTNTFTFWTDDEDVSVKLPNGSTIANDDTTEKVVKYFVSDVTNGYTQSYTLYVDYKGTLAEYTVNVNFVYGPACEGVEPGYFAAEAELAGDDEPVINVVSKPGAKEVDFRLLNMAKGSYATLDDTDVACVYQWSATDNEYVNVTANGGETKTQWKYFRSYKSAGSELTYSITVHLIDGSTVSYTVNVTFVD